MVTRTEIRPDRRVPSPRARSRGPAGPGGRALPALFALLVVLGIVVMVMALPRLSLAPHAGSAQQLWIMDVFRSGR